VSSGGGGGGPYRAGMELKGREGRDWEGVVRRIGTLIARRLCIIILLLNCSNVDDDDDGTTRGNRVCGAASMWKF
jgi:hypothetical protein